MENTRRFKRYPTQREARFFLKDNSGEGKECTIITVSRKGMGILFHTDENLSVGTTIRFDVPVATSFEAISVRGMLKWLDKAEGHQDSGLSQITVETLFENIHEDPRWLLFLERIGRSPKQLAAIEFKVTLPQ